MKSRYYRPAQERAATAKNPDVEELEKKVRELKEKHCQLILEKPKLQQACRHLNNRPSLQLNHELLDELNKAYGLEKKLERRNRDLFSCTAELTRENRIFERQEYVRV
ncbi:hypothetical protein KIN20_024811 [Parelaphostrongylus tenuis]|uniref:Uncharacterized protein n=1 Tax=Parelaphostrongylus tenuis TaxID=148309 RepID=A0AAD5QW84_PARTN|nr:hypothetical protein KIN20_024811 [Parelaphostrongylus tenuis]